MNEELTENGFMVLDQNGNLSYYKKPRDEAQLEQNMHLLTGLENEIKENLLGIFVVSFDTRLGNVVEWQIPATLDLERIEFKAMASGLHLVQKDLVYFCKDEMYGLAAYESLKTNNLDERNVKIKSVAFLARSYAFLRKFTTFLKNQVRFQLENPGNYDSLKALWENRRFTNKHDFFEDHKSGQELLIDSSNQSSFVDRLFNKRLTMLKQLSSIKITDFYIHTKFVLYFGPSIFTLWKYALLNKRLLFHSLPPINELCSRVSCSIKMLNTSCKFVSDKQMLKPLFYVGVMDTEELQQQPFYVACTTEKIMENREDLYDLYIDDNRLKAVLADSQKSLLSINNADKKRYDLLLKQIQVLFEKHANILAKANNCQQDESLFKEFFTAQNDKIFSALDELEYEEPEHEKCNSNHHQEAIGLTSLASRSRKIKRAEPNYVNSALMKRMGLDPTGDREFLSELIRFYDFNLYVA